MEQEHLNRIELRGHIGNIKVFIVGDSQVARFSLATNASFRNQSGGTVIETTWHNVSAWEGAECRNLDQLQKGDPIYVQGRIRNTRYTSADGCERTLCEVVASRLNVLDRGTDLPDEHIV